MRSVAILRGSVSSSSWFVEKKNPHRGGGPSATASRWPMGSGPGPCRRGSAAATRCGSRRVVVVLLSGVLLLHAEQSLHLGHETVPQLDLSRLGLGRFDQADRQLAVHEVGVDVVEIVVVTELERAFEGTGEPRSSQ